jgi:hypothetical protein
MIDIVKTEQEEAITKTYTRNAEIIYLHLATINTDSSALIVRLLIDPISNQKNIILIKNLMMSNMNS